MSISVNKKLRIGILVNAITLFCIAIPIVFMASDDSTYFRFGPSDTLILVSIAINTKLRYCIALSFITLLKITDVAIDEIANPIVSFNIYNPDKTVIDDFYKNELQIYGNLLYGIDATKQVFLIMVSITQIDIALVSMVAGELASIVTIRMLLNEKTFSLDEKKENRAEMVTEEEMHSLV